MRSGRAIDNVRQIALGVKSMVASHTLGLTVDTENDIGVPDSLSAENRSRPDSPQFAAVKRHGEFAKRTLAARRVATTAGTQQCRRLRDGTALTSIWTVRGQADILRVCRGGATDERCGLFLDPLR